MEVMSWWPLWWLTTPERIEKCWTICHIYFNEPLLQFMSIRDTHSSTYTPTIISSVVWELGLCLHGFLEKPSVQSKPAVQSTQHHLWRPKQPHLICVRERSICYRRIAAQTKPVAGTCWACAVGHWIQWCVSPVHILLNLLSPILRPWNLCVNWRQTVITESTKLRFSVSQKTLCFTLISFPELIIPE